MDFTEKTIEENCVYQGRIINVRRDRIELPNKEAGVREVVEHSGGVCAAALTDEGEVLLVEQFRYPYKKALLEIPAGKLEKGEDPLACGRRELEEETGAHAQRFVSLGELYPSPGYCAEIIYMYAAFGLSFGQQKLDKDEFLNVRRMKLEEAVNMVLKGEIKDAKTQAALLKLYCMKTMGGSAERFDA